MATGGEPGGAGSARRGWETPRGPLTGAPSVPPRRVWGTKAVVHFTVLTQPPRGDQTA